MHKILSNLALIYLTNFVKEHTNIDMSGSHLVKLPRRWVYSLVRDTDGKVLITVTFHKNQVPTFTFDR